MKIYLITGGAGNVGSAMAKKLAENPDNVVLIADNLSTGSMNKVPKKANVDMHIGDVCNHEFLNSIFEIYRIDVVIHYAAVVGVERVTNDPLSVFKDIQGIKNILDLSVMYNVKKVVFASSSEVYGIPVEHPQKETSPLNAVLPYAIVKNVGESYFRAYQKTHGLDITIFRFFNTYGPNQSEDFVLPKFLKKAWKNEPIVIYGDGSQTRSFCYVDDNVNACLQILEDPRSNGETYNIGSDHEIPIKKLASIIIEMTNSKSEIIHVHPLEEGDMPRRRPDLTKMREIVKTRFTTLPEGILKMIQSVIL